MRPSPTRSFSSDISLSALVAGVIAVVVAYGGPAALIFQAAAAAKLSTGQLASWVWAISIGSGLAGVYLSLRFKVPIIIAWSTPGAALLVTSLARYSFPEAIGAYIFSGAVIAILGVTGVFSALMDRIPKAVVAAMLAGILLRFGMDVFVSLPVEPWLVAPMVLCYLLGKRFSPRYAIVFTLAAGFGAAAALGKLDLVTIHAALTLPEWTTPTFSLGSIIGLGVPLCLVSLTGQSATGLGVLRASGYHTPAGPLLGVTGILSVILAPFGCHGVNLAAITAAICTGPEAHADPNRRYVAGLFCGMAYLVVGLFGATLVGLFTALPSQLIAVLSGLALFGAIISGLTQAMEDASQREAGLVTFLVTASGVSLAGIGPAFWGLVAGVAVSFLLTGNWAIRLREAAR